MQLKFLFLTLTIIGCQVRSQEYPLNENGNTNRITNSISSLEALNCKCDINTGFCDDKCCCDSDCPASYIDTWKVQGVCQDQEFIYSTSTIIPCSQKRPKTLEDLRAGLRIYYQILKIFFCVAFDNSENTDRFQGYESASNINQAIAVKSLNPSTTRSTYLEVQNGAIFERLQIPRPSFGSSVCRNSDVPFFNNMEAKECYESPSQVSGFCAAGRDSDISTYQQIIFRNGSETFQRTPRTIYINDPNELEYTIATDNDLDINSPPVPVPNDGACTCQNYVSEIHYQIQVDENNNVMDVAYDLVVILEAKQVVCNPRVMVKRTSSVFFVNSLTEIPRLKGPGYRFGDPIVIGRLNDTTSNGVIIAYTTPLSFQYLNFDGSCATQGGVYDDTKLSGIEFGYNHIFSCSSPTFCNTMIFGKLANNFKYVSKFPNGNPNYINDWVSVTPSSLTCGTGGARISFYYSAIGSRMDPGYKINSVSVTAIDSSSSEKYVYVNFIPLPQSPEFFVAPNPTARVSLPDNVLTPFVTYRNT